MMRTKTRRKKLELVYTDNEPTAVILDINEYREILERLEDADDLKYVERLRNRPLKLKAFELFLSEHSKWNKNFPTKHVRNL